MDIQEIISLFIVFACAFVLLRNFYRSLTHKSECASACGKCPSAGRSPMVQILPMSQNIRETRS